VLYLSKSPKEAVLRHFQTLNENMFVLQFLISILYIGGFRGVVAVLYRPPPSEIRGAVSSHLDFYKVKKPEAAII